MINKDKGLIFLTLTYLAFQLPLYLSTRIAEYDESIYLNVARSIGQTGIANRTLDGGVLYAEHTSLYQHFIGFLYLFVGDQPFFFRFVTSLFGLGIVYVVWSLVKELRGWEAGIASGLIVAVNPFFHRYAFFIREEIWMCLFILLAVWSLAKDEQRPDRNKYVWWATLWLTLAFLTKELSLIFSGFAIGYLFLTGRNFRDRINRLVIPSFGLVFGFSLWSIWIYLIDPRRFQSVYSRWFTSIAGNSGGGNFDLQGVINWLQLIATTMLTPTFVILLLIGTLFLFNKFLKGEKVDRIVWLVTLYLYFSIGISLVISLKRDRHVMPIIFLAAIAIGLTINWKDLFTWLQQSSLKAIFGLLLLAFVLFEMSPLQIPSRWQPLDQYWEDVYFHRLVINDRHYGVLRDAGLILAHDVNDNDVVYVVNEGPVVGYYANRNYSFLYTGGYDKIVEQLSDASWLVVDSDNYLRLTQTEKEDVQAIIECAFEPYKVVQDQFRQLEILYKSSDVSFDSCLLG